VTATRDHLSPTPGLEPGVEPIEAPATAPVAAGARADRSAKPRTGTFRSLRHYNYRLYWTGALVSNVGTWMSRVAQDWLVLTVLTDHSSVALGVVTALQFLPMLLLAPYGGVLADRYDKRKVLMVTQVSMAALSLLMGVLTATGSMHLYLMYVLAFVFGMITAADNPARQAFVSEMVGPDDITNAVGLNSASFNFARLLGPGAAGLLIAGVGIPPAFFCNTVTFVAVLVALTKMRTELLHPTRPNPRGKGQLRAGLAYVRTQPRILLLLIVVFFFGTFAMNFAITNALMATQIFHKGPGEYGLLGSVMAIGSVSAALLTARRRVPSLRVLVISLLGFGVSAAIGAFSANFVIFALMLIPMGLCAMSTMTTANASVQLTADPAMRGRVMALYMAVFMGGTPIGAPLIGWIGQVYGARATVLIGGITSMVVGIAVAIVVMKRRHITPSTLREYLRPSPIDV
jgi:MFS family permease